MVHIRTLMDEVAENIEIDEGRMKDIFATVTRKGESAKKLQRALKRLGNGKANLGMRTKKINSNLQIGD